MTFPVYTLSQLNSYNRTQLWLICEQLNIPKYPSSQECRDAIVAKQPKLVAKLEASQHELITTEISFYDHEISANGQAIASISYDHQDFVTQPWVVSINGVEVFRDRTHARCTTWVRQHYVAGTLPTPETAVEAATQPTITEHEQKMEELKIEVSKHGLEISNVYQSSFKAIICKPAILPGFKSRAIGEIGCNSLNQWWVKVYKSQENTKVANPKNAVLTLLGLEIEEPEPAHQPETTPLLCPVCNGQGIVSTGDDIVELCQYCDGQGNLYTLQYISGAAPRTYRVYNSSDSMIGVIFQHITHWSNAMDGIRHFEAIDAAVCLDALMKAKIPQLA